MKKKEKKREDDCYSRLLFKNVNVLLRTDLF